MPFYLNNRDISDALEGVRSALMVPCRFCPAATIAVREEQPLFDLFRGFLRTPAYERYLRSLAQQLRERNIRTTMFESVTRVVCMWPAATRRALARDASRYDAVIVVGCEAAVDGVQQVVPATCRVIPAMEVEGIMNVVPSFHFPATVRLRLTSITRVLQHGVEAAAMASERSI